MNEVEEHFKGRKFGLQNTYPKFYDDAIDLVASLSVQEILHKNKQVTAEILQIAQATKGENTAKMEAAPPHVQKVCHDKHWTLFQELLKITVHS